MKKFVIYSFQFTKHDLVGCVLVARVCSRSLLPGGTFTSQLLSTQLHPSLETCKQEALCPVMPGRVCLPPNIYTLWGESVVSERSLEVGVNVQPHCLKVEQLCDIILSPDLFLISD